MQNGKIFKKCTYTFQRSYSKEHTISSFSTQLRVTLYSIVSVCSFKKKFLEGGLLLSLSLQQHTYNSLYLVRIFLMFYKFNVHIYLLCITCNFLILKTKQQKELVVLPRLNFICRTKRLSIPWHLWIKVTGLLLAATGYFPRRPTRGVYVLLFGGK